MKASLKACCNFYHNRVLEKYAEQETKRVTLRQLTVFGRHITQDKLLRSANYVRSELPVRLAHRIARFQQLPFVVGTNPHIERIYRLYWEAFEQFRAVKQIESIEDNREFCRLVQSMLNAHLVAIPELALGVMEARSHMDPQEADRFMNETLQSRIGRRVLAEQHIALSSVFDGTRVHPDGWIGIVNTNCKALAIVEKCAHLASTLFRETYGVEAPRVTIDDSLKAGFTYIPDHIEYIVFELLKNSMRFTHQTRTSHTGSNPIKSGTRHRNCLSTALPPIKVTIGKSESHIVFRVSDEGGGISTDRLPHIWSYCHESKRELQSPLTPMKLAAKLNDDVPIDMHYGLGLPLSRVYANYWGGNLSLYTMEGLGTDVYVNIAIGNQSENLSFNE